MSAASPLTVRQGLAAALEAAIVGAGADEGHFGLTPEDLEAARRVAGDLVDVAVAMVTGRASDEDLEAVRQKAKAIRVVPGIELARVLRDALRIYFAKVGAGILPDTY